MNTKTSSHREYPESLLEDVLNGVFIIPGENIELMMCNSPEETWNGRISEDHDSSNFVEIVLGTDEITTVLYLDGKMVAVTREPRSLEATAPAVRLDEMMEAVRKLKKIAQSYID